MKKMIVSSRETHKVHKDYSLGDFLLLLRWIEELKGLEISISKVANGGVCLVVGDNAYPVEDILPGHDLDE